MFYFQPIPVLNVFESMMMIMNFGLADESNERKPSEQFGPLGISSASSSFMSIHSPLMDDMFHKWRWKLQGEKKHFFAENVLKKVKGNSSVC